MRSTCYVWPYYKLIIETLVTRAARVRLYTAKGEYQKTMTATVSAAPSVFRYWKRDGRIENRADLLGKGRTLFFKNLLELKTVQAGVLLNVPFRYEKRIKKTGRTNRRRSTGNNLQPRNRQHLKHMARYIY